MTLLSLGIDKQTLVDTAPQLQPVIGRMELFPNSEQGKSGCRLCLYA
ncbi:hypothetical protein O9993_19795 [Vibrio lentus]|nr:hypothetical protein [Vibrio lentus]